MNQTTFKNTIDGVLSSIEEIRAHRDYTEQKNRARTVLPEEKFFYAFTQLATDTMRQRGVPGRFIIDERNRELIQQMMLYINGDFRCAWNINAGLIFGGNIGVGKTLLMKTFVDLHDLLCEVQIKSFHAKDLLMKIKANGVAPFTRGMLFIDEFGREEKELKDYGNTITPIVDLLAARYDNGARTFITTNFNYESLKEMYKEFIVSRMKEMCTYVIVGGKSRRVDNGVKVYGK